MDEQSEIERHIEAFIISRKAAMRSDATIACYQYSLQSLASEISRWPPTAQDIRAFLAECRSKGLSAVTIRDHWDRLSVWFRWLEAEGRLTENPMQRVERPSVPKPLPRGPHPATVQTIIRYLEEAIKKQPDNIWLKQRLALIAFLFDTGARNGEARTLHKRDLHLDRRAALVQGKGSRERLVTFGLLTQRALRDWLAVHPGTADWVFVSPAKPDQHLSRFGVRRIVQKTAQDAGVAERITPHSLRHAAALGMLDLGANIVDVRDQLGHHDITMTEHYARASLAHRRRLHDQYSPLDSLDQLTSTAW